MSTLSGLVLRCLAKFFIGGGNTFRLLNELCRLGLPGVIRDRLRHGLRTSG